MYVFFNDTATTEIYTLSLHDALPILLVLTLTVPAAGKGKSPVSVAAKALGLSKKADKRSKQALRLAKRKVANSAVPGAQGDRKSTRLNPVTPISRMPSSA